MITRLDRLQGRDIYENTALAKLNEVIDAVNELQNKKDTKKEPLDPYAKQREWIGKLCWFWDIQEEYKFVGILGEVADNGTYFQKDGIMSYSNCKPVKPDEDIIYKGGDNEL